MPCCCSCYLIQHLGVRSIRLATNNPRKMDMLRALGVKIDGLVKIEAPAHADNLRYLHTKRSRMAHRLELANILSDITAGSTDNQ